MVVTARLLDGGEMECTSPYPAVTGYVPLEVSTNGQDFSLSDFHFEYQQPVAVHGLEPSRGPSEGGTFVNVTGSGFSARAALLGYTWCRFNSTTVVAVWRSTAELNCIAPRHAAGVTSVEVTQNEQQYTNDGLRFEYESVSAHSIYPSSGPVSGGTTVEVRGAGIEVPDARGLFCQFGGAEPVAASHASRKLVICVSPPAAEGSLGVVPVRLVNNDAVYGSVVAFTYRALPVVQRMHPVAGMRDGGTLVTLYGSGFVGSGDVRCSFGLVVVTARLLDAYSVECVSPSAALLGYVPLEVSTNGKDFSTSGWTFEIMHRPAVLSVAPSMGPASGGSLLAVEGVHFSHRASSLSYLVCRFNLTEVVASWQSATSILCLAPRSPPGVVLVAVANTPSSFSAERASFEYSDGMVTSMSPSNGPITGGVLLSLFGHGFSPSYTAGHHCVFGDIASSEATVLSTSLAVCDTPFLTYPVITRVQLRLDGALIDTGFEFSFESPPTVLDIHPRSGPLAGGTQVIVVGHQFTSVPSMYCRFAGIFAMAEYISATRVKCASPPYVLSANATFEVSRGAFGPPFASAVSIYHATSHLPCLLPFL